MAGTERTGKYLVIARNSLARIGFRVLGWGEVRVRIEPVDEASAAALAKVFTRQKGWKQPGEGGQNRFSKVCGRMEALLVLGRALRALRHRGKLEFQPGKRHWRKELLAAQLG